MLEVTVLVGDPIELDDIINQSSRECLLKEALYDAITVWVGEQSLMSWFWHKDLKKWPQWSK